MRGNCWVKRRIIVGSKREFFRPRQIGLACRRDWDLVQTVLSQDKALRKRNLSGGGTSQLSDSAAASVGPEAVLLLR